MTIEYIEGYVKRRARDEQASIVLSVLDGKLPPY